jgi:sRNA-binding carbon storage regulator CsrA
MLVVSRKADQSMVLAQRIYVTVVEVLTSSILVEIRGPKNTRVDWEAQRNRRSWTTAGDACDVCMVLDCHGTILINREISMTVVSIRQEKARLGFIAPKNIQVIRGEVAPMED